MLLPGRGTTQACQTANPWGGSGISMIGLRQSHAHSLACSRAHMMQETTEDEEDKMEKARPFKNLQVNVPVIIK